MTDDKDVVAVEGPTARPASRLIPPDPDLNLLIWPFATTLISRAFADKGKRSVVAITFLLLPGLLLF
jgi:hypothetical protein